jgi:iron-sulfur cluster repair protein YtfE (RIC family)
MNWQDAPLGALIRYLETEHHAVSRGGLFRIGLLFAEACRAGDDVRLMTLRAAFRRFTDALVAHLEHEELTAFPAMVALEESWTRGEPPPARFEGGIRAVVGKLVSEHHEIGRQLRELREAGEAIIETGGACPARLLGELEALERHIQEYLSLENDVAFPRAVALEDAPTEKAMEVAV